MTFYQDLIREVKCQPVLESSVSIPPDNGSAFGENSKQHLNHKYFLYLYIFLFIVYSQEGFFLREARKNMNKNEKFMQLHKYTLNLNNSCYPIALRLKNQCQVTRLKSNKFYQIRSLKGSIKHKLHLITPVLSLKPETLSWIHNPMTDY